MLPCRDAPSSSLELSSPKSDHADSASLVFADLARTLPDQDSVSTIENGLAGLESTKTVSVLIERRVGVGLGGRLS